MTALGPNSTLLSPVLIIFFRARDQLTGFFPFKKTTAEINFAEEIII
jgi:hypothetical protein